MTASSGSAIEDQTIETTTRDAMSDAGRRMAVALAFGVGLGLFSLGGDVIPVDSPLSVLNSLANATGAWTVTAFVVGAVTRRPRDGALLGPVALAVAVATYYIGLRFVWGDRAAAGILMTAIVWLGTAAVAGSVVGMAGGAWAGPDRRWRVPATAVVCGALLAEPVFRFVQDGGWRSIDLSHPPIQAALVDVLVGVTLPVVLLDRGRRTPAYLGSIVLALLGSAIVGFVTTLAQRASFHG